MIADDGWLAGLMEGEGCFGVNQQRTGRISPRTMLYSNDEDVVRHAYDVAGGVGAVRKDRRDQGWWWTTSGYQAIGVSLRLYPYLGRRRQGRITEVLQAWMQQPRPDYNGRERQAAKTHCKNGHLFDDANTHINDKGHRNCRACWREWSQRKKANDPGWAARRRARQRELTNARYANDPEYRAKVLARQQEYRKKERSKSE